MEPAQDERYEEKLMLRSQSDARIKLNVQAPLMSRHVVMDFKPWEQSNANQIIEIDWNQNALRDKSSRDYPKGNFWPPKIVNQSGPHFDVVLSHHQFFNLFAVLYLFHFIPLYIFIYGPSLHIITSNSTIMYFPWNTIPYKVWMAMSEMIMMGHRTVITDVPWAFFWSYNILFARYFLPLMMMACNPLQPILTHYNPL